jgi:hypothetical protein
MSIVKGVYLFISNRRLNDYGIVAYGRRKEGGWGY